MRTQELANELGIPFVRVVANKVRNDQDRQAIEAFCAQHGMAIIGTVPQDELLAEAERQERSPFDFAPDSPAVASVRGIADAIEALALARPPSPADVGTNARA
jgi:CO dehydrogenase maturation factor